MWKTRKLRQNLYDEGVRVETPGLEYERRVRNTLGSRFPTEHVMLKTEHYAGDVDAVVSNDSVKIAVEAKVRKSREGTFSFDYENSELLFMRYDQRPDMRDLGVNRQMREYLEKYPAFVLVTTAGPSEHYFTYEGKPCAICRYNARHATQRDKERLFGVIDTVTKMVEKKTE